MGEAARADRDIPQPDPANPPPGAAELRAAFDAAPAYTIGIEDEVMLLDPETLELAPVAQTLLDRCHEGEPFKLELPASQLEIAPAPRRGVEELAAELLVLRRTAQSRAEGLAELATAGVHPLSRGVGALNRLPRYRGTFAQYGAVAARQLVCALQVHVAVGEAERALAVYNAARSYLPCLAALGANAPIYEGGDTGLASVRPEICRLLPRQGVPPVLESWEALAETYRWGAAFGSFSSRSWWWELRPHPRYGTLEFRVPDGQSDVAGAAALAAVAQALVVWLGERHEDGEALPVAPAWQIEENRWSACRHGVEGAMADLRSGAPRSTREVLHELLDQLEPVVRRLQSATALAHARALVERNGAIVQREVFREAGPEALARWLVGRFLAPGDG